MSRRTRPKDPFRDTRRQAVNEELRERLHKRFVAMYSLLKGRGGDRKISHERARELAADYAVANRSARRRHYGERGERDPAPTMTVPKTRKRTR